MAPEEDGSPSMGFEEKLNPRTPKGKPWNILLGLSNGKDEEVFSRQLKQLGIELNLEIVKGSNDEVLPETFDMAILDESRITKKFSRQLKNVKKSQEPVFTPVLALIKEGMRDKFLERYGEVMSDFLTKPLKKETLNKRIRNLLHLRYLSEELSVKHRAIIQNSSELISIIDEEGNYLFANESHKRLLGHDPDELVGKQALDIIPEREEQDIRDEVSDLLEKMEKGELEVGEGHGRKEYIVTDKEGNDRWVESDMTPLSEVDGTKRFLITSRDITARKRQQKKLRKYRDIVEVVDFPVMFQDLNGKYVIANEAVAEYADIPKDELHGKDEGDFMDPNAAERIDKKKTRVLEEEVSLEYEVNPEFPTKGDRHFLTNRYPYYDEQGNLAGTVAICKDVTERKKAKQRVEYLNELYQSISEINKLLIREEDFSSIMKKAREILLKREHYVSVEIAKFDRREEETTHIGYSDSDQWKLGGKNREVPNCVEEALRSIDSVIVDFPEKLCQDCNLGRCREDEHESIALPLANEKGLSGAMVVKLKSGEAILEEERELLEEVASDLAYAYEKLRTEEELEETTIGILEALSQTVEEDDEYTGGHIDRVQEHALALGEKLGLSEEELEQLRYASELHDVGKVKVPDKILGKPGDLNEEEWKEMEKHPKAGEKIVANIPRLSGAATIVGQHQEKYDGTGYPEGLQGEEICQGARIIAVVDAWDAMRTDRPYRDALPREVAVKELKENKGSQFDPEVVDVFLGMIGEEK